MHVPVLPGAVLEWLRVRPGGTYVDCTAGFGGHAELICRALRGGKLIALDRDPLAVQHARERLAPYECAEVVQANYSNLARVLRELGVERVDGVLIDAGMSSMQLDDPHRGFTFQHEGPLDMRQDTTQPMTAQAYLSTVGEPELVRVLREYGDVRPAQRIARAIVERRGSSAMNTTSDLRQAIQDALPFVKGTPDEVRTVFQAIRIAVNDEYHHLEEGIQAAIDALAPEGRIVVISFHSGEDRIVKNAFRAASRVQRTLTPDGRVASTTPARLKILTSSPVTADDIEVLQNSRAKSAKLRAAERLHDKEAA
ncbi:MAG TPA: 16S rRNA (cytosine(1402)-N(4))-methyltransferase RsmH [Candidatus Hydrogenedentes bacterium]|nr:16S rRNA (cytosine(1402)-N(4))-methyltransferase RsmH [Candidatus Hydrogenedentota bacterium]